MIYKQLIAILLISSAYIYAENNLIAHYDLREGKGPILNDKSANHLDCKLKTGQWIKTRYGNALQFNGKTIGAYGPSSSLLNIGKGNFTVCVFLKIPKQSKYFRILEKGAGDGSNGYRLSFNKNLLMIIGPEKPVHYMVARANGGYRNRPINDGKWHFISCVVDRENTMQLYVDGEPSGKAVDIRDLKGLPVNSKNAFLIYRGINEQSSCIISDITIYRKALTPLQIKEKHADILQKSGDIK